MEFNRRTPLLIALLLTALLAGCSSIRVNTDFAEGTDFSRFQTFQYRDSENSLSEASPLNHTRIVNAIRGAMTSSGFQEVDKDPDVFVTYYGSTDEETHFHTTYSGVSAWNRRSTSLGFNVTSSTTRPTTVTRGTLVIDVWDAAADSLIWRGVAESTLSSNPERNTATINQAIEKAFRDFPPE